MHYVIMTADPRKMKGHLKQPPETTSCLIVQHGWQQWQRRRSGMSWTVLSLSLPRAFDRVTNTADSQYDTEAELSY